MEPQQLLQIRAFLESEEPKGNLVDTTHEFYRLCEQWPKSRPAFYEFIERSSLLKLADCRSTCVALNQAEILDILDQELAQRLKQTPVDSLDPDQLVKLAQLLDASLMSTLSSLMLQCLPAQVALIMSSPSTQDKYPMRLFSYYLNAFPSKAVAAQLEAAVKQIGVSNFSGHDWQEFWDLFFQTPLQSAVAATLKEVLMTMSVVKQLAFEQEALAASHFSSSEAALAFANIIRQTTADKLATTRDIDDLLELLTFLFSQPVHKQLLPGLMMHMAVTLPFVLPAYQNIDRLLSLSERLDKIIPIGQEQRLGLRLLVDQRIAELLPPLLNKKPISEAYPLRFKVAPNSPARRFIDAHVLSASQKLLLDIKFSDLPVALAFVQDIEAQIKSGDQHQELLQLYIDKLSRLIMSARSDNEEETDMIVEVLAKRHLIPSCLKAVFINKARQLMS